MIHSVIMTYSVIVTRTVIIYFTLIRISIYIYVYVLCVRSLYSRPEHCVICVYRPCTDPVPRVRSLSYGSKSLCTKKLNFNSFGNIEGF